MLVPTSLVDASKQSKEVFYFILLDSMIRQHVLIPTIENN